jgi:hypothetical protein
MALIHGRSTYSFMSCEYFDSNFLASSTFLACEVKENNWLILHTTENYNLPASSVCKMREFSTTHFPN